MAKVSKKEKVEVKGEACAKCGGEMKAMWLQSEKVKKVECKFCGKKAFTVLSLKEALKARKAS